MDNGNETALRQCRFLNDEYFKRLYDAFIEAFSDYVIPFALTETQFRNHLNSTAVDLSRTVGCIEDGRIVGFSLNGFGLWDGITSVYDAGTGVVPRCRRKGVSEAMFEMMLPVFKEEGIRQFLLEVVTTNTAAIDLYEKFGFRPVRDLALLQCDRTPNLAADPPKNIELRAIDTPDWALLTTFWDGTPSWQNSVEAVGRSRDKKTILGAFLKGTCVGYIVFSSRFGRVAQLAVDKEHRTRGIGSALLGAMRAETAEGFSLQVINIDKSLTSAVTFFNNRGYYERLGQFEMLLQI
jgi:ribosomal protein S18 acetylase RimI-like enzyme